MKNEMQELMETVGKGFKSVREKNNMSLETLVKKLEDRGVHIDIETIQKIEEGTVFSSAPQIKELEVAYDTPAETFLPEEEPTLVEVFEKKVSLSEEDKIFLEDFEMVAHAIVAQEEIHKLSAEELKERRKLLPSW